MTTLSVPYVDTRAADLNWALGLPPLPALALRTIDLPGGRLHLRLLGSSHQVVLRRGDLHISEAVACLPATEGALPSRERHRGDDGTYDFSSRVLRVPAPVFGAAASAVLAWARTSRLSLWGTFPGQPHAFTAILASVHDSQVRWQTWHTYPQSGEIVATRSRVTWAM